MSWEFERIETTLLNIFLYSCIMEVVCHFYCHNFITLRLYLEYFSALNFSLFRVSRSITII